MPTPNPTQSASDNKTQTPEFGNGRYSALMAEAYEDSMLILSLTSEQAEKLARQIGSDYGAIMASTTVTMDKAKVSKTSKDGKVTVSEASAKVKNVTMTNALFALRTINYVNECGKHGFIRNKCKWAVSESFQKYLDTL